MTVVKMIVAVDDGNAIGWSDGRLPWKVPYDMKRFKELTTGHTVVMGFNTFKSLNMPNGLPGRKNIVLTRKPWSETREHVMGDVDVISNLDWIERGLYGGDPERDLWIIGGASVYAEALERKLVEELHVTFVHDRSGADVSLPFDLAAWKLFVLHEQKKGVNWSVREHIRPTVTRPSPGIDILVFRREP